MLGEQREDARDVGRLRGLLRGRPARGVDARRCMGRAVVADEPELAGLRVDEVTPLLAEWDYGDYEGLTTPEIRENVPGWTVWTHDCPGGESIDAVTVRADRAVGLALSHMAERDVVFIGHGHFSRSMLTRWIELPVSEGIRVSMVAASIAVCGFEHGVRQISALGLTGHTNPCLPA